MHTERFSWPVSILVFLACLVLMLLPALVDAQTNVQARVSQGQTFLTWTETNGVVGYNIYRSNNPITSVSGLTPIALVPRDSGLNLYTNQRLVVQDNAAPLAAGVGVFVYTAHATQNAYYAVLPTGGNTVTASIGPVAEVLAAVPGAVQLGPEHDCGGRLCTSYMAWEDAATWMPAWGYYGRRFDVAVVGTRQAGQTYPLFLDLHGAGASNYAEPSPFIDTAWQGIFVFPVDLTFSFGFTDPYTGQGQLPTAWFGFPCGTQACKATEDRIVRYTRWVAAQPQFQVDATRVYVKGASMGGGGAMHVGMHHPELFAAVAASIAWVAPSDWGNMWSSFTAGAPVLPGSTPYSDYLNGEWWAQSSNAMPPIVHTFRKDDNIIPPNHYPSFLTTLEATHRAYVAKWQNGGHNYFWLDGSSDPASLMRFKLNEAYPAFANASSSDAVTVQEGQRNTQLDWSSSLHSFGAGTAIVDASDQFAISLKSLTTSTTATVSILNTQAFHPAPGSAVTWQNTGAGLSEGGSVTAGAGGIVTVPLTILATGNRLSLGNVPPPPPALTLNIPDFCASPTITATADGAWSNVGIWSQGRVPGVGDVVNIPTGRTVTYDVVSDAALACVGVKGTLTTRTDISTRLTTGMQLVYTGGTYTMGTVAAPVAATVTAELVIADRPLNLSIDPEQYGTGFIAVGGLVRLVGASKTSFLRTAGELAIGQTVVPLTAAPSGWRAGDQIIVPGTDQWFLDAGNYVPDWETPTIASVSGTTVTLSALQFEHGGAHNVTDGALRFTPHVGNLTRNVIVRSANPTGTRGHVLFTGRADVDIRYSTFQNLGRTTIDPLDNTTNHIGRYSMHFHHLPGPVAAQSNGYQFTFIGNVIRDGHKWGMSIHDSHFGLVQDTVVYNVDGWGIGTEDGNETRNVIEHNFVVKVYGTGEERGDLRGIWVEFGHEGSAFWFRGADNYVRHNVAANTNAFAYTVLVSQRGNGTQPRVQGADPMVDGVTVNLQALPLREFADNEAYAVADGLTIWDVGTHCCTEVYELPESVVDGFKAWHFGRYGYYGYAHNRLTFSNWVMIGKRGTHTLGDIMWSPYVMNRAIWFGDYITRNQKILNPDIQGFKLGIQPPFKPGDVGDIYGNVATPMLVQGGRLWNEWNIAVNPMFAVTGGDTGEPPRATIIDSVTFGNLPGNVAGEPCNICMAFNVDTRNANLIQKDTVTVTNYNGTGQNFQAFYAEQAPGFTVPVSSAGVLAAPVSGLTNAQLWAQYGLALAGAVAPCSTTQPLVQGFACAVVSDAPAATPAGVVTP